MNPSLTLLSSQQMRLTGHTDVYLLNDMDSNTMVER
jgi:hypothetical protein